MTQHKTFKEYLESRTARPRDLCPNCQEPFQTDSCYSCGFQPHQKQLVSEDYTKVRLKMNNSAKFAVSRIPRIEHSKYKHLRQKASIESLIQSVTQLIGSGNEVRDMCLQYLNSQKKRNDFKVLVAAAIYLRHPPTIAKQAMKQLGVYPRHILKLNPPMKEVNKPKAESIMNQMLSYFQSQIQTLLHKPNTNDIKIFLNKIGVQADPLSKTQSYSVSDRGFSPQISIQNDEVRQLADFQKFISQLRPVSEESIEGQAAQIIILIRKDYKIQDALVQEILPQISLFKLRRAIAQKMEKT